MPWKSKLKLFLLLISDLVALYGALLLTLLLRFPFNKIGDQFFHYHVGPFTFIFIFWLLVFYIAGLYDIRRLRNTLDFFKTLAMAMGINAVIAIAFFYLIPFFGITPRTNLFLFLIIFTIIEVSLRPAFNKILQGGETRTHIMLVGSGATAEMIYNVLRTNPQLGYEVALWKKEGLEELRHDSLPAEIAQHGIELLVIPRSLKLHEHAAQHLYQLFSQGIEIQDFPEFYEQILRKVPLSELGESWFLEHLSGHQRFYDPLRRSLEFFFAIILQIIFFPFEVLVVLGITLTSRGSVLYVQERIGRNGKSFACYKFRTMTQGADKDEVFWTKDRASKITGFGRFLRATHIDEWPQLINIIRGELSFVGPRAEWRTLADIYAKEVTYYPVRQLVLPGLTGWAQINYRANASVEDTAEKLEYDLYYIKNRSALLDIAIIVKTLKAFIINPH